MILVLCPTRGRPAAATDVIRSLTATRHSTDTRVLFVVDEGDPLLASYMEAINPHPSAAGLLVVPGGTMVKALNEGAQRALAFEPLIRVLGFIGDDHRFRTKGWDEIFLDHIRRNNVAMMYAHDGARSDIPTQIFVTPNVVHALGWFAPPMLKHLYVDDAWRAIGESTETLFLFKDVLVEHMHPAWGKAESDAGYERVNSREMYDADAQAFNEWRHSGEYREAVMRVMNLTMKMPNV